MDNLETWIAEMPRPEPSEVLDRRIELLLAESRPALPRRSNRRKWLAGLAAAAAVAVACWLSSEPGVSLAQMQAAVQSKPWVHLTRKGLPADSPERHEIWLSVPRDVIATVDNGMIRYTDLRLGTSPNTLRRGRKSFAVRSASSTRYRLNRGWAHSSIFRGDRLAKPAVRPQSDRGGRKQRLIKKKMATSGGICDRARAGRRGQKVDTDDSCRSRDRPAGDHEGYRSRGSDRIRLRLSHRRPGGYLRLGRAAQHALEVGCRPMT